jgi:hypothetical protein
VCSASKLCCASPCAQRAACQCSRFFLLCYLTSQTDWSAGTAGTVFACLLAGSTAHSFTSLYSILADQGEAGSEAAGPSTAAAAGLAGSSISHMGGAMSPFRGSDAGGDVGNSVSTLPLISEAAYDDEQQLMQEVDELAGGEGVSGRVSGFDEAEEDQIDDGFAAQTRAAAQGALVMSGISGRPRVSSSHGSITSAASDASLSAPGSVASGATGAAIGARMPSPAGASSGFGRPVYGSQRSSGSRHSLHQQQQQQQQAGSDSRISTDLPPFGSRKRPDDDTCSYATQAGEARQAARVGACACIVLWICCAVQDAGLCCCRAMLDWLG